MSLDDSPHDRFADSIPEGGVLGDVRDLPPSTPQSSESATGSRVLLNSGGSDAWHGEFDSGARARGGRLANFTVYDGGLRRLCPQADRHATGVCRRYSRFRVMLIGEAPGEDEDRIGRPFVGRAGQLLDRMLNAIGLDRQKVYIANIVPWRPPGNRTPTPQETEICLAFIEQQIHLADPEFLVCLGGSASRTMLGVQSGIMRARGSWFNYPRRTGPDIRALAMLHPAFLLRQPAHKRLAWADMRALASTLKL